MSDVAAAIRVKAVGETGLDFNRNFSPPDVQRQVFEKQLELACQVKLPLFVHDRDSDGAVFELLSRHGFGCRNFRERSYRPWWCNEYVNHSGSVTKVCWTDLICGHRSVARFAADWQTQLLGQYCNAQRRLCHGGGAGVSCSALHSNFRASCVGTR